MTQLKLIPYELDRVYFQQSIEACPGHIHLILSDFNHKYIEQRHEISKNVVCAISKASDQPAHMRSLTITFASRLNRKFCQRGSHFVNVFYKFMRGGMIQIALKAGHHWPTSETPFKWRFAGGPMMALHWVLPGLGSFVILKRIRTRIAKKPYTLVF